MDFSQESDHDFWSELEHPPTIDFQISPKKPNSRAPIEHTKTLIPCENFKEEVKLAQSLQESWEREKLERTVERIKQANHEYLKNIKITVRNQTKKELKAAVLDIQSQFQLEVVTIKRDHDRMKEEISNKTREILEYGQYCVDQHYLIFNHQMKSPEYFKAKKSKIDKEINEIKSLINVFKVQLDSIKEITAEYSKEAQVALMKVKEVDGEIQKINSSHQMSVQMLKQAIGSQEEDLMLERNKIQEEFDSFKNKISQEIEIRKLLDKRQQEFIASLQTEIKDAKIILQNPRMRIRVHEKLKESNDDKNLGLPKINMEGRMKSVGRVKNDLESKGVSISQSSKAPRTGRNRPGQSFYF